ncbi:MAG TPA: HPr family phosphocarrier protein [Lachnospiraceae bacterium]|nr:HPr family phosphocarrier protein [Lachnospiraceae bacterium]
MSSFDFTVKDPEGIHARPAGIIVNAAKGLAGEIKITKGEKTIDAKKLFALMGLGVKSGETITVSSEDEGSLAEFKKVLEENL